MSDVYNAANEEKDPDIAERARIIAETASDAIITIDQNSQILFINRAAETIFGYSLPEMLGQQLTMLMPEALRHLHRAGLKRYVDSGQRHISWSAYELPGLHKDGREITLELSFGEFIRNGERFFTGIARDITKRKRDELRLILQSSVTQILAESSSLTEASVKLLETICRHLGCQVGEFWIVPAAGKQLNFVASWHLPSANVSLFISTARRIRFLPGVGIPGKIWLSKSPLWLDHIPNDERYPRRQAAKLSGLNAALGFPIIASNQIVGVIDFLSDNITKPDSELMEMMTSIGSQIGQFIERNNAQEEVQRILGREHEARVRAEGLTRQLSALQRVTDATLAHYSLNDLLSELLRRIREVLNVDTAAVLLLEKEENELVAWAALGLEEEVERGIRIPVGKGFAGKIIDEARPVIVKDLEESDVYNPLLRERGIKSLLGVPLIVEGRRLGVLHVGAFSRSNFTDEDVRFLQLVADRIALSIERAKTNEFERRARTEAERANRLKDEFLTILSHELRAPLTPIVGWSQMIQGGLLPQSEFGQALEVISKNSQTLKRLIDDLLDMSAILSGKMRIERGPVSLEAVLRDAIESVRPQARAARIELIAPDFKQKLIIKGDHARLVQAFCNLLQNSIKFTGEGGSIEISQNVFAQDVLISIKDSGKGIEADFLPHVFERFRQADGSRTRHHGGLGLGLALVKSFVEAHGGEISARSDGKDRGSIFSVRLPVEFSTTSASNESACQAAAEQAARILIVEDQPDTRGMLEAAFTSRGFEITSCASAAEALHAAQQSSFDAVISDIAMPDCDGLELIRNLREIPEYETTPAVALSGYASEKDARVAVQAGFDQHVGKPFDPVKLTGLIEGLLSNRRKISQLRGRSNVGAP
jgi:PAS domain S-box-containing protein